MTWINFLHFYQPANIDEIYIKEAFEKSYSRLISLMLNNKDFKCTVNISGCLLDRLFEKEDEYLLKGKKIIDNLVFLVKSGQLELVSSAAYHAFLPLLPEEEVRRQIRENKYFLEKYLGKDIEIKGFFSPEMGYSLDLARIIKEEGYDWIILDPITAVNRDLNFNQVFIDSNSDLKIIFRNRNFSRAYPPDEIQRLLLNNSDDLVITATDAELYGLRHEDPSGELEKVVNNQKIKTERISDFINTFSCNELKRIELRNSSWESEEEDILRGKPFILWNNEDNLIHQDLWALSFLALSLGDKFKDDENFYWHRWHLVRGLASCNFWWASAIDFSFNFGPYAWNPDIVERGLEDLIRSIRAISNKESLVKKLEAEDLYVKIKNNLWREHWLKHWN